MTEFNPNNKEILTYGECLSPAMTITDTKDAEQYLNAYASFIQKSLDKKPRTDGKTALDIARYNIGYYAGYCDSETSERVNQLFGCSHPIFDNPFPTAEDLNNKG